MTLTTITACKTWGHVILEDVRSQVLCVLLTDIVMIGPAVVCHHILMTVRLWTHFRIFCPTVCLSGRQEITSVQIFHTCIQRITVNGNELGTSWGQEVTGSHVARKKKTHTKKFPQWRQKEANGAVQKATTLVTLGLNHATGLKIWHLVSATAVPLLAGVVRCVVSKLKSWKWLKKKKKSLHVWCFLHF